MFIIFMARVFVENRTIHYRLIANKAIRRFLFSTFKRRIRRMKVISLLSMKGGTAKTTTAVNLAAQIAKKGKKVLLVDADAQGNATATFTKKEKNYLTLSKELLELNPIQALINVVEPRQVYQKDLYDVLMNPTEITEAIYPTYIDNLYLVPSQNYNLIQADKDIAKESKRPQHNRVEKALRIVRNHFDYVIIDNAPTSNIITVNSLVASDLVIIPVKPGGDEIDGLKATLGDIQEIAEYWDLDIDYRILFTMFHKKKDQGFYRQTDAGVFEFLTNLFKDKCLSAVIRYQDGAVGKASINRGILIDNKITNESAAQDYIDLGQEILKEVA